MKSAMALEMFVLAFLGAWSPLLNCCYQTGFAVPLTSLGSWKASPGTHHHGGFHWLF